MAVIYPVCCVKELMVLPWSWLKKPVLMKTVEAFMIPAVIEPVERFVIKAFCVLKPIALASAVRPIVVEIDDRPSARVEKVDPIIELVVEKKAR